MGRKKFKKTLTAKDAKKTGRDKLRHEDAIRFRAPPFVSGLAFDLPSRPWRPWR